MLAGAMIHQKQAALIFYLFAYYCNKCINMLLFNSVINIMFFCVNYGYVLKIMNSVSS